MKEIEEKKLSHSIVNKKNSGKIRKESWKCKLRKRKE